MDKKHLIERWFNEVFTKGDKDALKEITAPDFVSHVPGHDFKGHEEYIRDFMDWYRNVFTDDVWTINDYFENGEKAAVRYTGEMNYQGGWFNVPSQNQRVKETGMMIVRFQEGLIQEMWCEMSDLHLLDQLQPLSEVDFDVKSKIRS
ncbi:nuclear transport factor 2 family protein [Pseudalkalibacillus sp. SCS-8]|uniref:ester cyclase n=1 Tax=Pseudalkalibacillus nanhaiensis TaxID=3115291 RepID=UPI0032DB2DEF